MTSKAEQLAGRLGTTTNDSAAAGEIGEYVESVVGSTFAPATGAWGDLTSISLSAGDWDISAVVACTLNGATMTTNVGGIGTATGNNGAGIVTGDTRIDMATATINYDSSGVCPCKRVSLASTMTYYLKMIANYSAGTPKFYGRISARRVR